MDNIDNRLQGVDLETLTTQKQPLTDQQMVAAQSHLLMRWQAEYLRVMAEQGWTGEQIKRAAEPVDDFFNFLRTGTLPRLD